jgi:hypothetical protein
VVVRLEPEAVPGGDLALEDLERLELELDHLAASPAQEVVVVVAPEGSLVAAVVAGHDGRLQDAGLGQQRQRPVDGRLGAADPAPPQVGDEVVDGVVPLARHRRLDDGGARLRQPELLLVKEALEAVQRLLRACVQGSALRATVSHTEGSDVASRVSTLAGLRAST